MADVGDSAQTGHRAPSVARPSRRAARRKAASPGGAAGAAETRAGIFGKEMGAVGSNSVSVQQDFYNNISQTSQQNCIAKSVANVSGNVVYINGSRAGGNIVGVSTGASTDASCLMVASMEDTVTDILKSILQQTNQTETDWFNGFSFTINNNSADLRQTVVNNINQISQQTCSADTINSTTGQYIYITNAQAGGDIIGISTGGAANASCNMSNYMKNATYNEAQGQVAQKNSAKGMIVAIVGAIVALLALAVVAVFVLFATGAVGYVGYRAVSGSGGEESYGVGAVGAANAAGPPGAYVQAAAAAPAPDASGREVAA